MKNKDLSDIIAAGEDPNTGRQSYNREELEPIAREFEEQADELERQAKDLREKAHSVRGLDPEEALNRDAPSISFNLNQVVDNFGKDKPIQLPWEDINEELDGGLWPGFYVLVGSTGTGKSQWALQTALHAAKKEVPVLYVALELGRQDLVARLLGLETKMPWRDILRGRMTDIEKSAKLQKAKQELERLHWIHQATGDAYGWPYTKLEGLVKSLCEKYQRPPLVVLDFLQLVTSPVDSQRDDLRTRIQKTAYTARIAARNLNATVLMLSSTSREKYKQLNGQDGGPWESSATFLVGTGKESGEIEYAADGVFIFAKEPWPDNTPPKEGSTIHFGVAKNRCGPAGSWVPMRFNGSQFEEIYKSKKIDSYKDWD